MSGRWRDITDVVPTTRTTATPTRRASAASSTVSPLQSHLFVGGREIEQRVQADRGLLDTRTDPVQRRRLEDRGVHDPLVHQPLDLVELCLALLPVALPCLLHEQIVDVRISTVGR